MKHHWAFWMIVGGLALDLVDTFTAPAGQTGGVFYAVLFSVVIPRYL